MADDTQSEFEIPTVILQPSESAVVALMREIVTQEFSPDSAGADDATVVLNARPPTTAKNGLEGAGTRIGNYVLKKELGRGGFGTVWWAEQVAPFRRDVALKIILQGMDTEEVVARFEAEKKLLAKMDHPNIAAVYDAGTTDRGRPFFVMEMVKGKDGPGKPITKFCDERHLSVRERIELFIPVCQAVQHAHMKQVLHRDLKPTNILVSEVDGVPVPKIIDFGIAKAMSPDDEALLASRMRTAQDMVIGTLQYMSPEQAGSMQDIDTRSDVYTLGVILYELLVGEPPLGKEDIKKAVFEVLQQIREGASARRPSTRWHSTTEAKTLHAMNTHGCKPRRLAQQIDGDLDWIVLKALEKDRTRRYSAATDLADDLSHYLRNEPVSAGPPSGFYRLKKLIQRHKVIFSAGTAIMTAIIVGGGAAFWQWREAVQARNSEVAARMAAEESRTVALQREKEALTARQMEAGARKLEAQARKAADDQRQIAEAERAQAEKERGVALTARTEAEDLINYMLFDLRDKLEPLNRIELLDDVAAKAESYFKAQPADAETDAQKRNRGGMWQNRGQIALAMGRTEEAAKAFQNFHRIMAERTLAAPQDPQRLMDLAIADGRMSLVYEQSGHLAEAQASALAEHQAVRAMADRDKNNEGVLRHLAATYERLGDLAKRQSQMDQATAHYQSGMTLLEPWMAAKDPDPKTRKAFATLCERLADLQVANGRLPEALALYTREASTFDSLLKDSPADPSLRRAWAVALQKKSDAMMAGGNAAEAEKDDARALEVLERLSQADPGNLYLLHDLALAHQKTAALLMRLKRPSEARTHWDRDMEISTMLAAADPGNARWQSELAVSHWNIAQAKLREGSKALVAEAVTHFNAGRKILSALKEKGQLDETGAAWLPSFEKAIEETALLGK